MYRSIATLGLCAVLALTACDSISDTNKATATGATAGAVGGAVLAKLLGAEGGWTAVGALAGAAAGAVVARNDQASQCYYAKGDGSYYKAAC
ncbi:MAG: glucose-6-phosphate isomerase [Mangrovicoccus sp.]